MLADALKLFGSVKEQWSFLIFYFGFHLNVMTNGKHLIERNGCEKSLYLGFILKRTYNLPLCNERSQALNSGQFFGTPASHSRVHPWAPWFSVWGYQCFRSTQLLSSLADCSTTLYFQFENLGHCSIELNCLFLSLLLWVSNPTYDTCKR